MSTPNITAEIMLREAEAYRRYNRQFSNQQYHELVCSLAECTSATDAPYHRDWEWGVLVINASLEVCGHPGYDDAVVGLFRELADIEDDDRLSALQSVIAYLWLFSGDAPAQPADNPFEGRA